MSHPTKQKFQVLLTGMFQRAGVALSMDQIEALRNNSNSLVDLIETVAKDRVIELIRKMQEAVGDGFTKIGTDIDALETRVNNVEKRGKAHGVELSEEESAKVREKLGVKPEGPANTVLRESELP